MVIKFVHRKVLPALCALALLSLSGVAAAKKHAILSYVPADTPYALVAMEPMPDAVADKFEPAMDDMLASYRRIIHVVAEDAISELEQEEDGAAKAARVSGLLEEITGLMSVEAIRAAGVARDARFAIYSTGLLPVVRLELDDTKAFEAALGRIEERAGEKMAVATIGKTRYRYLEAEDLRVVFALIDGYAVLTAVPAAFDDEQIGIALGIERPSKNIAKSRELRQIVKDYQLTEHLVGFVSTRRIVDTFLGEGSGQHAAFMDAVGQVAPVISPVCRDEIKGLADVAPRMVFGYTSVTGRYLDSRLVVELRKDIAAGLSLLTAPVPGLGADPGGLWSAGFSLNLLALRNFYEERLDAMEADPFECELFAELQAGVAKGREVLAQPVPPVVYGFRGMLLNVSDMSIDFASDEPPRDVDAGILFAVDNAATLVSMAAMMDPNVAALNLLPDGKPVKLDLPQIAELTDPAFAALSDGALALTMGNEAERKAATMLGADLPKESPFFSMAMDAARYYDLIGEAIDKAEPGEGEEPMPPEVREAVRDVVVSSGKLYERLWVNVGFTDRGVDVGSRMTLAN